MRGVCLWVKYAVLVGAILHLASCGKGGGIGGAAGALQGKGLLGDVGDVVRGYAANSRAMIEIRSQVTMLISKLNMIALRRAADFSEQQVVEKIEGWMDSVVQKVFGVSLKRAQAAAEEARIDFSTVSNLRRLMNSAYFFQVWRTPSLEATHNTLFTALFPALWVEFLNYRARAIIAMLNGLHYSLESLTATGDRLNKLKSDLQSVTASCPI